MFYQIRPIVQTVIICTAVFLVSSCRHEARVINIAEYQLPKTLVLQEKPSVGVFYEPGDSHADQMRDQIARSLQGRLDKVIYRLEPDLVFDPDANQVDYLLIVELMPMYKGSGWNFLISWPGYIIFTPYWHGFNYRHDYSTRVRIVDPNTRGVIDTLEVPIEWQIRHADKNRTWIQAGWLWLDPWWTVVPLISGFMFMDHDPSVKDVVERKFSEKYGDYMAERILEALLAIDDSEEI